MTQRATAPLRFDAPVALIGGGDASDTDVAAAVARAGAVVAADGGANRFTPDGRPRLDAVIGDMDSIADLEGWRRRGDVAVLPIAEQETTDFEKCLYSVAAPLYLAAGFFGRRHDHTLAAFHTLLRRVDRRVILIGPDDVAFVAPPSWTAEVGAGARISFFPLAPCRGIASSGLRWPIDGLDFAIGARVGTSNIATADRVSARFNRPAMAVLLERDQLDAAIESLAEEGAAAREATP